MVWKRMIFRLAIGWFLGSMLIFRGVRICNGVQIPWDENITMNITTVWGRFLLIFFSNHHTRRFKPGTTSTNFSMVGYQMFGTCSNIFPANPSHVPCQNIGQQHAKRVHVPIHRCHVYLIDFNDTCRWIYSIYGSYGSAAGIPQPSFESQCLMFRVFGG